LGRLLEHLGRLLEHLGRLLEHLGRLLEHLGRLLEHLAAADREKGPPSTQWSRSREKAKAVATDDHG